MVNLRGTLVVVAVAVGAGGCGADGGDPDETVIGRWMETLTPNEDPERLDPISYHADGTWVFGAEGSDSGTWSIEGDRLFHRRGPNAWDTRWDSQFAIDDGRLLLDVMRPDGEVDGPVGAWFGIAHGNAPTDQFEERVYRLTIRADGIASYSAETSTGVFDTTGFWRQEGHFLFLETSERTLDFAVAPTALGHSYYQRLDD